VSERSSAPAAPRAFPRCRGSLAGATARIERQRRHDKRRSSSSACSIGVYDKAAELVQDALTHRQRALGGDDPLVANSPNSLGAIELEQGAHSDARRKPSHH